MKIAFLVLNHRNPRQLIRLLTTLRSQLPESPIVVHHDILHGALPAELLEPIGNVHLLVSGKRVIWGDYSIAEVCCWSLAWMRQNLDFDWMVLLSAQDYPIKPLSGLADNLTREDIDAVLFATPVDRQPRLRRILMRRRYLFQYRAIARQTKEHPARKQNALRRITWSWVQALNILQSLFTLYPLPDGMPYRFGWRALNNPFRTDQPCWQGSQWFALSRKAFEYLLDYTTEHPEFVDYYRRTMIPDESMFVTILCNSTHLRIANRNVTYTRWTNDRSPHPEVFQLTDLEHLSSVPQYFARKFDIDTDSFILDALDARIVART